MSTLTKQQKKAPRLRFKQFNGEWKSHIGEEVTNKITKGSSPRWQGYDYQPEGVLFITSENVRDGYLDISEPKYLPEEFHNSHPSSQLNNGDILINIVGASIGRNCLYKLNEPASTNQAVALFRPRKGFNSDFLAYYYQTSFIQNIIGNTQVDSARPNVSLTDLRQLPFVVPEESEQQKIADFLGSVDTWLDNLRSQKTALETYKRGMMHKLFTQQVRFRDGKGNVFPEWQSVRMSDLGDTFNGLTGKTGDDFGDEGEPFITYKQIFDSASINPSKFAKVKITPGERQSQAQRGDILFTTSSETPEEVGYASVLTEDLHPYLNSFSFGLRPNSLTKLLPEYARYHFRSAPFRRLVVRLAQGSTRYNISKVQFMKLVTELPSYDEQQKIADFLTAIDQTITAKTEEITQVEQWKKGLMQKMFV